MLLDRKIGLSFCLALTAMVSGSVVTAQEGPAPNSGKSVQTFRAKQILGSKVTIKGDASVGTVDDLVLDEHGNVDYLIVANTEGQLVTVPWDAADFSAERRMATLQITPEQFKRVPTYTAQQYPVYSTPTYRTQTYQYYGLTPGQARRMVRRGAIVTP